MFTTSDGVLIMLALCLVGTLFLVHPPAKATTDPVTGITVKGPAVIMISKDGCAPCQRMKSETLPRAAKDGYEVQVIERPCERYPTTRIFDGSRWSQRVGFFEWGRR